MLAYIPGTSLPEFVKSFPYLDTVYSATLVREFCDSLGKTVSLIVVIAENLNPIQLAKTSMDNNPSVIIDFGRFHERARARQYHHTTACMCSWLTPPTLSLMLRIL